MENELKVVVPLSMFTELVTKAGQLNALERMVKKSKYSIDRQEIADLFGFELPVEDKEVM